MIVNKLCKANKSEFVCCQI